MEHLIDCLYKKGFLEESEKEYYLYGLKVLMFNILTILIGLIVAKIYQNEKFGICFLIVYIMIRINLGGYHCSSPEKCLISFLVINIVINYLSQKINNDIIILIGLMSNVLIYVKNQPIKNNKKISINNILKSKKRIAFLSIVYSAMVILDYSFCLQNNLLLVSASFANILNCALYYIEILKRKNEENIFI
ncbi:MAG: accessory gene regulator B family protein [Eggerthia catenaformis]|uniref:accessory gene regulator B family protein n=1 Tax=Eggerthia catenaformis TaxID=31973 RepID=UPI00248F0728|nr:accessory gene regulator B family protein [Eggerthia catenaformis]